MAVCHLGAAVAAVAAAACFACSDFEVEPRGRCVELVESFQEMYQGDLGRPTDGREAPDEGRTVRVPLSDSLDTYEG